MTRLTKFLLASTLSAFQVIPAIAMDVDGDGMSLSLGGSQSQSIQPLLHSVVATAGDMSRPNDMKVVFETPHTFTANILGPSCVVTCEMIYNPTQAAPLFSRSLNSVEKDQGLFSYFTDSLRHILLWGAPEFSPEYLAKLSLKADANYQRVLNIAKSVKDESGAIRSALEGASKQIDQIKDKEEEAERCVTKKIIQGFPEFTQVFSVPANPILILKKQNSLTEGKKTGALNVSTPELIKKAKELNLYESGFLQLTIKSVPFLQKDLNEYSVDGNINPARTTLNFSETTTLDDITKLIESEMIEKLMETVILIEQACTKESRPSTHM